MKKIILPVISFFTLNGCIETTALLGPAISVGPSGNVYQASISYASNQIIYSSTGKTTIEHVSSFLDREIEFDIDMGLIFKDNTEEITEKVFIKQNKNVKKLKKQVLTTNKDKEYKSESEKIAQEDQFILF